MGCGDVANKVLRHEPGIRRLRSDNRHFDHAQLGNEQCAIGDEQRVGESAALQRLFDCGQRELVLEAIDADQGYAGKFEHVNSQSARRRHAAPVMRTYSR